jgi:hypothetical protein
MKAREIYQKVMAECSSMIEYEASKFEAIASVSGRRAEMVDELRRKIVENKAGWLVNTFLINNCDATLFSDAEKAGRIFEYADKIMAEEVAESIADCGVEISEPQKMYLRRGAEKRMAQTFRNFLSTYIIYSRACARSIEGGATQATTATATQATATATPPTTPVTTTTPTGFSERKLSNIFDELKNLGVIEGRTKVWLDMFAGRKINGGLTWIVSQNRQNSCSNRTLFEVLWGITKDWELVERYAREVFCVEVPRTTANKWKSDARAGVYAKFYKDNLKNMIDA